MSDHDEHSLIENITGLGWGIPLLIIGLVMTIGNLGPGIMVGFPMILLGLILPVGMTYNARTESIYQAKRRRPEHDSNATYSITTKKSRRS